MADITQAPTTLQFGDIQLDLGSFVSSLVGPVVQEIKQYTTRFQSVMSLLTSPIPELSASPRFESCFNSLASRGIDPSITQVASVVQTADSIITDISDLSTGDGDGVMFNMGSFNLDPNSIFDDSTVANILTGASNLTADADVPDVRARQPVSRAACKVPSVGWDCRRD